MRLLAEGFDIAGAMPTPELGTQSAEAGIVDALRTQDEAVRAFLQLNPIAWTYPQRLQYPCAPVRLRDVFRTHPPGHCAARFEGALAGVDRGVCPLPRSKRCVYDAVPRAFGGRSATPRLRRFGSISPVCQ